MTPETIHIIPHGFCCIIIEHDREWAICKNCGAQWALDGADLEEVKEGDGYCDEHAE